MKKILSSLLFLFLFTIGSAQDAKIDEIAKEGIRLHDAGLYNDAIEMYKKGLAIDKKNSLLHYEIGYSYSALKNYDKAIYHAKKTLKSKDRHSLSAYVLMGNSYDNNGDVKKSIATYEKGIKDFPNTQMLHFNYGITLFRQGMKAAAEAQFIESIALNPSHTSSNYYLGVLKADQGMKTQAHLALYFFLLLEPDSERSENAMKILGKMSQAKISQKGDNEYEININLFEGEDSDFTATDLMLSLGALNELVDLSESDEENEAEKKVKKTDSEKFYDRMEQILLLLKDKREGKTGVYWEVYYDLFADLQATDNLEAFSYFISQKRGLEVEKWMQDNEAKMEKLGLYFDE